MATTTITVTTDDIDGSEHANTYRIINPEDGRTYTVDLAPKNFDRLCKALAPFLEVARPATGSYPTVSSSSSRPSSKASSPSGGTRKVREYDKAAYRAWAEANGRWTGSRPTHADIDAFEASSAAS
jgi:Lsr2